MAKFFAIGLMVAKVMFGTGVLAQEQPADPDQRTHRFFRELGAIIEQSAGSPRVTVVGVMDMAGAAPNPIVPLDTLLRVGERPIASIADLADALTSVSAGTSFDVVVRRGNEERTLRLTVAPHR